MESSHKMNSIKPEPGPTRPLSASVLPWDHFFPCVFLPPLFTMRCSQREAGLLQEPVPCCLNFQPPKLRAQEISVVKEPVSSMLLQQRGRPFTSSVWAAVQLIFQLHFIGSASSASGTPHLSQCSQVAPCFRARLFQHSVLLPPG